MGIRKYLKDRESSTIWYGSTNTPIPSPGPRVGYLSGGTPLTPGDGYEYLVFTSTGPLTVNTAVPDVEYLVVAGGGGGGGGYQGGGGGAGGFRTGTGFPVTTPLTITVGGGGAFVSPTQIPTNGNDSIFSTITSTGGGRGGYEKSSPSYLFGPANTGGSGGGGVHGGGVPGAAGNTPPTTPPQGNPGGNGFTPSPFAGGGGGGAGGAGGNSPGPVGGNGGVGSPITWLPASYGTPGPAPGRYFAGGGAGITRPGSAGTAGAGGGGAAGAPGTPGTINTGGGGGASSNPGGNSTSGNGGSGIVIIRYLL